PHPPPHPHPASLASRPVARHPGRRPRLVGRPALPRADHLPPCRPPPRAASRSAPPWPAPSRLFPAVAAAWEGGRRGAPADLVASGRGGLDPMGSHRFLLILPQPRHRTGSASTSAPPVPAVSPAFAPLAVRSPAHHGVEHLVLPLQPSQELLGVLDTRRLQRGLHSLGALGGSGGPAIGRARGLRARRRRRGEREGGGSFHHSARARWLPTWRKERRQRGHSKSSTFGVEGRLDGCAVGDRVDRCSIFLPYMQLHPL
ncbi:hypothetical protein U9M48_020305, partial [Paspalum notatum var. saurae]